MDHLSKEDIMELIQSNSIIYNNIGMLSIDILSNSKLSDYFESNKWVFDIANIGNYIDDKYKCLDKDSDNYLSPKNYQIVTYNNKRYLVINKISCNFGKFIVSLKGYKNIDAIIFYLCSFFPLRHFLPSKMPNSTPTFGCISKTMENMYFVDCQISDHLIKCKNIFMFDNRLYLETIGFEGCDRFFEENNVDILREYNHNVKGITIDNCPNVECPNFGESFIGYKIVDVYLESRKIDEKVRDTINLSYYESKYITRALVTLEVPADAIRYDSMFCYGLPNVRKIRVNKAIVKDIVPITKSFINDIFESEKDKDDFLRNKISKHFGPLGTNLFYRTHISRYSDFLINDNEYFTNKEFSYRAIYNIKFEYIKGETIEIEDFDYSRSAACSRGIHLFMNRDDAIVYSTRLNKVTANRNLAKIDRDLMLKSSKEKEEVKLDTLMDKIY